MLTKQLLHTITYYDCLDYPLTAFEAWKHLLNLDETDTVISLAGISSVMEVLQTLTREGRIVSTRGMYTLPGRENLILTRLREEKISVQKLKRARRLISFLQWVPYVRMIGITGSLAMKKSEPRSDWDFFVVIQSGHIWLGRTLLTLVLHLLGKRRHGRFVENRACLNYYLTEEALEITPKDIFAAHEYRFLIPILDQGVFSRFELANRWIATFKPNFSLTEIPPHWQLPGRGELERLQQHLERWLNQLNLESWLSRWQRQKIAANPKTHLPGSFIETSDRALIFLPQPKGPKIFDRFKLRLSETHS